MPLDGLSVHALRTELSQRLINARVMKIFQPWPDTVILHLRAGDRNERLLLSSFAEFPTAHLTKLQPENPLQAPVFAMVLRKHLEPARLLRIEQIGLDRIIHFVFEAFDEDGQRTERTLVAELTGRAANLILLDTENERVIDALRRGESGGRSFIPGANYTPPRRPVEDRRHPFEMDPETLLRHLRLAAAPERVTHILMQRLEGVGRFAAEEILYRTVLAPNVTRGDVPLETLPSVAQAAIDLIGRVREGQLEPTLLQRGDGLDCWIFPPKSPGVKSVRQSTSLSDVVDEAFAAQHLSSRLSKERRQLTKLLRRHLKRTERKLQERIRESSQAEKADEYRHRGDLLAANLYRIEPRAERIEVADYLADNTPVEIALDPRLTPAQNVQAYYKRYQRAKRAAKELERLLTEARMEAEYLAQVLVSVELAEAEEDLEEIAQELREQGLLPPVRAGRKGKDRKREPSLRPMRFVSSEGHTIWVGRNNRQNERLTLRTARPHDLWFHAQRIPGSHVILRADGPVSDQVLREAAVLAAYYSKARESANVPVDYVERRHVRKPAGGPLGYVIYDHQKTLYVTPDAELVAALGTTNEEPE